jgi:hypothetical protein
MKIGLLFVVILLSTVGLGQDFLTRQTGIYQGYLYMCLPNGKCDSVLLQLQIEQTTDPKRWKTTFVYLKQNGTVTMKNNYELFADSLHNDDYHFILDEKDGLLISETRIGNTIYGNYSIEDQFHITRTTYNGDTIEYELSAYSTRGKRESTSVPDEENTIWKVDSYRLVTVQKALLIKQP